MDLRHLRYFVVLAEELHFTRAATRLGIRQPPLSIQIRQLEDEVGAKLFARLAQGVELTAAGASFLADARSVLAQLDRAVTTAESLARGQTGRIRLGFSGATYLPEAVPDAILHFRALFPDVALFPEQSNTPALVRALYDKTVDVAFIRPPFHVGREVRTEPFVEEEVLAVLPAGHQQASRDAVALADLAHELLILFPREIGPGLHDAIVAACAACGFSPRLGQPSSQIISAVPMVAAGFGVSLVPASIASLAVKGAVYRPITGIAPRAPISLAWRTDDQSPALANFLDAMRSHRRALPPVRARRKRGTTGPQPS